MMKVGKLSGAIAIAAVMGTVFLGGVADAAVSETIAVGTMAHSELLGGPGTMTVRRLTIAPGEVLGWHHHPGIGAYTVVKRGALIVEDGCGGEVLYLEGQAFVEAPNRVHRGKNLGADPVETVQTFLVPPGTPISQSTPQLCGAPARVEECSNDGWVAFNHPRSFKSQGDCTQYVITGK